jgi:DNA-binding MarR family transcriptional regulator
MTPQSVGEHDDELERLGYLERVPDRSDRRAKLIRPTERGLAVIDAARRALSEIESEWSAAVGPRAVLQLRKTLEAAVRRGLVRALW